MKKNYIQPDLEIVKIAPTLLVAASGGIEVDGTDVKSVGGGDDFTGDIEDAF